MRYEIKLALRVALCFAIMLLPFDLFYAVLLKPTLHASSIFLRSYTPAIVADSLVINGTVLNFIPACIASLAYLLLFLLIMLTKDIGVRKRIKLFLAGSLIIFAANILRIDLLIYVYLEYGNDLFNSIHLFLWDIVSSVFVAALWIGLAYFYRVRSIPIYDDLKELYRVAKGN